MSLKEKYHEAKILYSSNAADNEKKDKIVDSAMVAEASSVSLLSWEERIYSAGEVGRVK